MKSMKGCPIFGCAEGRGRGGNFSGVDCTREEEIRWVLRDWWIVVVGVFVVVGGNFVVATAGKYSRSGIGMRSQSPIWRKRPKRYFLQEQTKFTSS